MRLIVGRGLSWCFVLGAVATFAGCGGPAEHPDTGYGANQPVPSTEDCGDLCLRLGDCVVDLCDEDTQSSRFSGDQSILADSCESTCTDSQIQSSVTSTIWQCVFQDSCRQVFGYDSCHIQGEYHCN